MKLSGPLSTDALVGALLRLAGALLRLAALKRLRIAVSRRTLNARGDAGWAGYLVRTGTDPFAEVEGSWRQPHVVCSRPGSSVAFWVGLGGANRNSDALEQVGTSADCSEGALRPLARPQVYVDESGDAPIAPDIVSVVVTNDDAGLLTLGVSFANRTGLLPCDVLVVGLDVDRDKRTGGPMGMDYALSATTAAAELGVWSSSSWSGSGYVPIPGAASFSLSDHSVVLSTSVDQLGALMALQRPQLRFVVIALASTDRPEQNWTDDVAGPWTYQLRPPTGPRVSKVASRSRGRGAGPRKHRRRRAVSSNARASGDTLGSRQRSSKIRTASCSIRS